MLMVVHHSADLIGCVAARLGRATQRSMLLLELAATSLHHVVMIATASVGIVIGVLRAFHDLNRFLVFLHLVHVDLVFFEVVLLVVHVLAVAAMVMEVIHLLLLLLLLRPVVAGPEASTACSRPRSYTRRGG